MVSVQRWWTLGLALKSRRRLDSFPYIIVGLKSATRNPHILTSIGNMGLLEVQL